MGKFNLRFIKYGILKDRKHILSTVIALTMLCLLITAVINSASWILTLRMFDNNKYECITYGQILEDDDSHLLDSDKYIGGLARLGYEGEIGVVHENLSSIILLPITEGVWFNGSAPQIIANAKHRKQYIIGEMYEVRFNGGRTIQAEVIAYSDMLFNTNTGLGNKIMGFLNTDTEYALKLSAADYHNYVSYTELHFFNMTQSEAEQIHLSNARSIRNSYREEIANNENYKFLYTYLMLALITVTLIVSAAYSITNGAENATRRAVWSAYGASNKILYILGIVKGVLIFAMTALAGILIIAVLNAAATSLPYALFGWSLLINFAICVIYTAIQLLQIKRTDMLDIINN